MAQVKDVVCGMRVDSATAPGRTSWGGRSYYFCSKECLERFDADPARYAVAAERAERAAPADLPPEPPHTQTGPIVTPKFGSAGSGGAELEPPTPIDRDRADQ
jgi:Cu+-exporting ATPase